MNAKLSNYMTLLGLGALAFYGALMGLGILPLEVMPQFVVSAVIFLTSGRIMRKAARALASDDEDEDEGPTTRRHDEADWPWLTGLLNATAVFLIVGIMAVILMKPIGVSFTEALSHTVAHEQFYAGHVP